MIDIRFYRNNKKEIFKFKVSGHSGFAEEGRDIVCSAVTVLVLNTVNSIEAFTDDKFIVTADENAGGFLEFLSPEIKIGKECHDTSLLLNAMAKGIYDIKKEYTDYLSITDEEVL